MQQAQRAVPFTRVGTAMLGLRKRLNVAYTVFNRFGEMVYVSLRRAPGAVVLCQ